MDLWGEGILKRQSFTKALLLSKYNTNVWYTSECNFIYTYKKNKPFSAPILKKVTNT